MTSLFDSRLAIGVAGATAIALGVLGAAWLRGADAPGAAAPLATAGQAQAAGAWAAPIGPGALAAPASALPGMGGDSLPTGEPQLALDGGGHLVPSLALRKLVDSYLGNPSGAQRQARANELRAYLKGRLKAPALAEALRIVSDYLGYLEIEEQLLARERFARPDPSGLSDAQVEHLLAWQQQRSRLRERTLGTLVAQAWFETEDANCATALSDWRLLHQAPAEGEELESNELRARRVHGPVLEQRRNMHAQACASLLVDGLAARG
ncbi:MAG: hypothetical protein ACJ8LG_08645 [Massilia sp.]